MDADARDGWQLIGAGQPLASSLWPRRTVLPYGWCYAAIRPRFGAGAKTAMCAGAFVWFVGTLAYSSLYLYRLVSSEFMCVAAVTALVEFVIGAYVGCQMYSEPGAAA